MRRSVKCKACGVEGNGYDYVEEERIVNYDGKPIIIEKKYWKCLACGASTFVNAFQRR